MHFLIYIYIYICRYSQSLHLEAQVYRAISKLQNYTRENRIKPKLPPQKDMDCIQV